MLPRLERAGHRAIAPTLEGPGLESHIGEILRLLDDGRLEQVILAGHGYAGMVITGVAERAGDRLSHLFFLNAFLPRDGESIEDLAGKGKLREPAEEPDMILPAVADPDGRLPKDRLRPFPRRAFQDRLRLEDSDAARLPRTFVHCKMPCLECLSTSAERARRGGARFQILSTGHYPMIEAPSQTADLLMELEFRGVRP